MGVKHFLLTPTALWVGVCVCVSDMCAIAVYCMSLYMGVFVQHYLFPQAVYVCASVFRDQG